MKVDELVRTAKDTATVRRVFGEPVVDGGVTVIPAATVAGGAGGGTGKDGQGQEGEGGGWGVQARPAGAYVIKDGRVSWRPAVDVNRIVAVAGVVTALYLVLRQRTTPARRRR
jgi:uncharacterized spore protein YtfJ